MITVLWLKIIRLNQTYQLDISNQNQELLENYYTFEGKVKDNLKGEVLPLGDLSPIMTLADHQTYDLLASQRIIGVATVDGLGVIQIYLTYKDGAFVLMKLWWEQRRL